VGSTTVVRHVVGVSRVGRVAHRISVLRCSTIDRGDCDESSDSDEALRLSFESVRRPTIERPEREIVIEEEILAPAPAPEAPDSEYKRPKKDKKKSKISAARAVFEED
jgi:hypothetical protein